MEVQQPNGGEGKTTMVFWDKPPLAFNDTTMA